MRHLTETLGVLALVFTAGYFLAGGCASHEAEATFDKAPIEVCLKMAEKKDYPDS